MRLDTQKIDEIIDAEKERAYVEKYRIGWRTGLRAVCHNRQCSASRSGIQSMKLVNPEQSFDVPHVVGERFWWAYRCTTCGSERLL